MSTLKHWLLAVAVFVVLTVALTLPLLNHIASSIPHDAGDPVLNTWILWWNTQRLPFTSAWWNAPMFFPIAGAFAFSEVLLGLLPMTAPVQWLTGSPLVAYNVAFALSFLLCGLAAYGLAVELIGRHDVALLSGIAFAFAPYRMGQLSHLQVLSYYGAPLALLSLHAFVRTSKRQWLACFGAAWLLQALSNGYALFHLALLLAFWIVWFARPLSRALSILVAWAVASLPILPLLLGYQRVHTALNLTRSINEIKGFGVDLGDVFTASPDLALWGGRLWPVRPETAIFPGATMMVVGAIWVCATWWERRGEPVERTIDQKVLVWLSAGAALVAASWFAFGPWQLGPLTVSEFRKPFSIAVAARLLALLRSQTVRRAWSHRSTVGFYVIAMLAMYVLALGPEPRIFGRPYLYQPPYAWLMELPGFDTLRVPARFTMLAVLCQSVLIAFAVARWRTATSSVRSMVVAGVAVGLIADGWVRLPIATVPGAGPRIDRAASVLEIPAGGVEDFAAIYRGMSYRVPIVNGYSGYFPPHYLPLLDALKQHEYSVLYELTPGQPLGVVVNRASANASEVESALGRLDGVVNGSSSAAWTTFTVTAPPRQPPPLGPRLPLSAVRANHHADDVGRLMDDRVTTAWGSDNSQIGDEDVVADLGAERQIGAIVLKMGSFAFGFPRLLTVEISSDASRWTPAWTGQTVVETVRAAVEDPTQVPLTIVLGQTTARFVRLRQTGSEPGIPWWIAELELHGPMPELMAQR